MLCQIVLLFSSGHVWAADLPNATPVGQVKVEVMIGEATVLVEDPECPPRTYVVDSSHVAKTTSSKCDTVLEESDTSDAVNEVVQLIATSDRDDPDAKVLIEALLGDLSDGDRSLVIAVLINNAHHLGTNSDTVVDTIEAIATVAPESAPSAVFVAIILDPSNAKAVIDAAAGAAGPAFSEAIEQAAGTAEKVKEDLKVDAGPSGGEKAAAVVVVEETQEPKSEPKAPPINNEVPPG
ncbi:MAG: hypothetical protein V7746_22115, partial [Halioglobus sp.]